MVLHLTTAERAVLSGQQGTAGDRMALEMVTDAARILGADRLIEIQSSHIDGCLYHGASGVLYCEALAAGGARVKVPATTNVGALNLLNPDQCRLDGAQRALAYRLMVAHERMGCAPSWTCAPYQAGARPGFGTQIAWGESNAVAFANSVLGARTNRYGDFLDIACAIAGRAPCSGLHLTENRYAEQVIDVSAVAARFGADRSWYPVLGALIGRLTGGSVAAVDCLAGPVAEDDLKALCAGAASTGAVALIHIVGVTPEAPDLDSAIGHRPAHEVVMVNAAMLDEARAALSLAPDGPIDSVALGSPHFSVDECREVLRLAEGQPFVVPMYICLGRHTLRALEAEGADQALTALGVVLVVDTCVVVTPILPAQPGVMVTNSAKFAHYAAGNTGHLPVFGTLHECVRSAKAGTVIRDGVR
ncbi:MAG: aconitase X catalytic domain-containing protein [Pseudomonadota bacterium]